MRQRLTKMWLSIWLYVCILIAGIILGTLASNWTIWPWQTKLFALSTALLAFHVLEEWHFPGGFHTMYNLMADSDQLDRYPMNQLSDMWTNWIGMMFGCAVLAFGVTPLTAMMQVFMCFGEVLAHTKSGFYVKAKFSAQGKRTIYNPGLLTALFCYLPLGLGLIITFFTEQAPSIADIVLALLFGGLLMALALPGAKKICKDKNSPYAYTWGNGYFEKYL